MDRFMIYQSRNLNKFTDGAHTDWDIVFGHSAGLAFAAQITECEALPNPNDFGMLIRGLLVFGYNTIEPKYLGHAVLAPS